MSNKTNNTTENTADNTQGADKMRKKINPAEAVNNWIARKSWGQILRESGFAHRTEITDNGFRYTIHDPQDKDNVHGVAEDVLFGKPSRWINDLSEHMMNLLNTGGMSSVDKQKFVGEVFFQGDYEKMLKEEIIPFYEKHLENIEMEESTEAKEDAETEAEKDDMDDVGNSEDDKETETEEGTDGSNEEGMTTDNDNDSDSDSDSVTEVIEKEKEKPKKETPEEKKARKEQEDIERWHGHLNAFSDKFVIYYTEEGSRAWAYAESPSVVTIGSAGDLISEVRNLYGDNALPLKKDTAESIIDKLFLDLGQAIRSGEARRVKRVNRFYTDPESGSSWVYTANADTEKTSPFIKIAADGVGGSETPEGVVFDSAGELGEMEVDTSGTIEDFWKALDLVNIPKKDRLLVLGWLMTPVHATDSARPGILLRGGAGSGKTSTAIRLKEIIDPDLGITSESLAPTGEKNAFLASLRGSDTKIPGNLSGLSGTMSDAISQAMTGARYERDEKYTENKLSWTIKCSMIFSTINTGMVLQGDIQSRLFPIDVPEIPEHLRALGDVIEGQWVDILPRARGGLFKLISEVKAKIKVSEDLPVYGFRMIPAAKAMSAAELVLDDHGIEYTPWGDVYGEAITGLQRDALPSEIDFILNDLKVRISGRPGEVLKALHEEAEQNGFSTRDWSIKSARSLSSRLEENRPLLETKLKVKTEKIPGKANSIIWTLEPSEVSTREINIEDFTEPIV